jgi:phage terminase large subunit-like protein
VTVLQIPVPGARPWPTLGPQVWEWMLDSLVYGPGDLRGVALSEHPPDDEFRGLLYRMYEVFPRDDPRAGRRRFRRCALSLRKGTAKTERAAWIAAAELHPDAPVRCDGWRRVGSRWDPVGVGVRDPYIPLVAYTEEQTEDLAYHALFTILSEGPLADDFDIGLERIMRAAGDGKAVALASAPDARDGARTTFQHFDETHRFTLPRLVEAHGTMMSNLVKRKLADPWSLETTTAFAPGEGSVAERTHEYAVAVSDGRERDPSLFYFHRGAGDHHDLTGEPGVRAAVLEASGPAAGWSDIDGIMGLWRDPTTDRAYFERVWLNRLVQQSRQAFDARLFAGLARDEETPDGTPGTIGFDGSRFHDDTGLVFTTLATGMQTVLGHWRHPGRNRQDWEVPEPEVHAAVEAAFARYDVRRFYADPFYWESAVAGWTASYGARIVASKATNKVGWMAAAVSAYETAMRTGALGHDGDALLVSHIGNAVRRDTHHRDGEGRRLHVIGKERPDSVHKIDLAMAAILSWAARIEELDTPDEPEPVYARNQWDGSGRVMGIGR